MTKLYNNNVGFRLVKQIIRITDYRFIYLKISYVKALEQIKTKFNAQLILQSFNAIQCVVFTTFALKHSYALAYEMFINVFRSKISNLQISVFSQVTNA